MRSSWIFLAAGVLAAPAALAQQGTAGYPTRPVRVLVGYAPGGGVDLIARVLSQKLGEALNQTFVVDNRAGAGGNIATDMAAKAQPDGYSLLLGYVGNLAVNPFLFRKLPYDPIKDFTPISMAATAANILVVHPSVAAKTPKELVALAKAKPGSLNYASAGHGTVGHMVAELLKTETQTQITHVPYKGNGAAMTDLLAGNVQVFFGAPGAVIEHVRAGRLRAIAISSAKREPSAPDVPTFAEGGYPTIEATAWYALLGPAGMPRPIVTRLNTLSVQALATPEVRDRLGQAGYTAVSSTPEELGKYIRTELDKWGKVVKASGARVE